MRCDCGFENPTAAKYCLSCGATLAARSNDSTVNVAADFHGEVDVLAANLHDVSHTRMSRKVRIAVAMALGIIMFGSAGMVGIKYRSAANAQRLARVEAEQRALLAEQRAAQTDAIAAQKDTLLSALMASTAFMNQISDELSKIKTLKAGTVVRYQERLMPIAEYRAAMLERIRELGALVDSSEMRLQGLQSQLRNASGSDAAMAARLAEVQRLAAQYRVTIEEQRSQIERLMTQVETLQSENARLAREKTQLNEQYLDLAEASNTVYWIAGTKAQLLELGIITETGRGKAFLGIGGRKGTIVPARDLHVSDFTPLSKTADVELTLPKRDKSYQIVSLQPANHLTQISKDGTVRGTVRITDPEQFWATSKFLIFMEQ